MNAGAEGPRVHGAPLAAFRDADRDTNSFKPVGHVFTKKRIMEKINCPIIMVRVTEPPSIILIDAFLTKCGVPGCAAAWGD